MPRRPAAHRVSPCTYTSGDAFSEVKAVVLNVVAFCSDRLEDVPNRKSLKRKDKKDAGPVSTHLSHMIGSKPRPYVVPKVHTFPPQTFSGIFFTDSLRWQIQGTVSTRVFFFF